MNAALSWVMGLINKLWDAVLMFVSAILQFLVDILVLVLNLAVDAFFWALIIATSLLPEVPDLPGSTSFGASFLGLANYFFPFSEFLQGLVFIATVYAGVGLYKLAKFLRGGG